MIRPCPITPQLPDHPSQIKGIRSANDQMFTYSSWSSRSWLIVRGAQPAVQQQIGVDALKRLYEAKGFDPHLLRDVRRRFAAKSVRYLAAVVLVEFSLGLLAGALLLFPSCACMCVVGSDVLASCIAAFLHLSMAEYVVSSLLRALTARCRLPAKLLLSNFQTSSMAMRCSSLSRRMASCTYAMFRRTALHACSGTQLLTQRQSDA